VLSKSELKYGIKEILMLRLIADGEFQFRAQQFARMFYEKCCTKLRTLCNILYLQNGGGNCLNRMTSLLPRVYAYESLFSLICKYIISCAINRSL